MNPDGPLIISRPTWRRPGRGRLRKLHAVILGTTTAHCGTETVPAGDLIVYDWDPTNPRACPACVRLTRPAKDPT